MAQTYADLKQTVADYLHRGNLTSKIPGFITRGENELNRRLSNLSGMEDLITVTLAAAATGVSLATISATINKIIRVWRAPTGLNPFEIPYLSPQQLLEARTETTGPPQVYTVQRGTMRFDRAADQTYTDIVAHITKKLDIATTPNVVSETYEEAYIYASLKQAEPYLKNDKRIGTWATMLDETIEQILQADRHLRGEQNSILIPDITRYVGRGYAFDWRAG